MPSQALRASDVSSVSFRLAKRQREGSSLTRPHPEAQLLWLLADFKMAAGWHIYWLNPGDSGIPTNLKLDLPAGVSISPGIQFPIPKKFPQPGGFIGYGYEEKVTVAVPLEITRGAKGIVDVSAIWLVCKDVCLSGHASAKIDLGGSVGPVLSAADLSLPRIANGEMHLPFEGATPSLKAVDPKTASVTLALEVPSETTVTDVFPLPAEDTELTINSIANPHAGKALIDLTSTSYAAPGVQTQPSQVLVVTHGPQGRQAAWVSFPSCLPTPTTQPSSTIPQTPDVGR